MRNEKHPDRLEPIQGENTVKGQAKDSDYLLDSQNFRGNSTKKLSNIMDGMGLFAELKMRKEAGL